jgi:hypothetical protein
MNASLESELACRKLVPLADAARTLGLPSKAFVALLARHNVPIVQLSPRKRAILLPQLDMLIAQHARPVVQHEQRVSA